jgi:Fe-S oxidoreductase
VPALADAVLRTSLLSGLVKRIGGIAPERTIPPFARETFVRWFRRRQHQGAGRRVVLWPDTFNNYFRPQTAMAAVQVLEAAGFEVTIPAQPLCCGRPLYDWGWIAQAKALWERTFRVLGPEIEAGTPVIGLEPACVSAFKDELGNLYPRDDLAGRLGRQVFFFSDFIAEHGSLKAAKGGADALVHIHCHQHAVIKVVGERRLLDALGVNYEILASGCCGMAGAFGFEADKYAVSQRIGERVLLPRVREAAPATVILANGFSCREQIEQSAGRPTLHIAELAARALHPWGHGHHDRQAHLGDRGRIHSVEEHEHGARPRLP